MSALETIKKGLSDLVAETKRRWTRGNGRGNGDGRSAQRADYLVSPRVDIYETPEHVTIFADLPGVKQRDLEIQAMKDRLVIRALRADRGAAELRGTVPDGYQASYVLNPSLDPDKIDAQLRDGVLRLLIPRSEAARPRRIEVKVQGA